MSVDRAEVRRIAILASLELTDTEADRLTDEMNRILEHAARLREVEPARPPGAQPSEEDARPAGGPTGSTGESTGGSVRPDGTRSDDLTTPDTLARPIADWAPATSEGFFLVPPPPGVHAADDEGHS